MDGAYTAQTESFMVLFSTLAFLFLLKAQEARSLLLYIRDTLIAGFFMGIAIAFKQTAILSAIALFAFLLGLGDKRSLTYKSTFRDSFLLFAAVVFPMCLSLIPLLASGVTMIDYFKDAWLILMQKEGGSADYKIRIGKFIDAWGHSKIVLFYPLILLFIVQKKRIIDNKIPFGGIVFWIGLDFLGVNASGYYLGHQFKQILPSIALASGIAINVLFQANLIGETERRRYIVQTIVIIAILWAPYQTLYRFYSINIKGVDDEYGRYKQLGLWIKEHTKNNDYIYILGDHTNKSSPGLFPEEISKPIF